MAETRQHITDTRSLIRAQQRQMRTGNTRKHPAATNPAAAVHSMLKSDAFPSQILAVINNQHELTSTAEEMKEVMADHFSTVFSIPPCDVRPLADPPPMLLHKEGIQVKWYSTLMAQSLPLSCYRVAISSPCFCTRP